MPLVLGGQSASAEAYSIENSVRFNGSDEGLTRTSPSDAPTLTTKFTLSFWCKLAGDPNSTGGSQFFSYINNGVSPYAQMLWNTTGQFQCVNYIAGTPPPDENTKLLTSQYFRDPSAWYHFVWSFDSTPATPSASSIKLFVNGTEVTDFATSVYPAQDTVGRMCQASVPWPIGYYSSTGWFSGYYAEIMVVDGQALDADSFGQFNADSPTIWEPIDISGITVGNQGFYLDFKDSSNLGNLVSGIAPDFTSTALSAFNQCTDTPTNNFCTGNSVDNYFQASTFTNGNNTVLTASSPYTWNTGTVALSAGLWYWEIKVVTAAGSNYQLVGVSSRTTINATTYLGDKSWTYGYNGNDGKIFNDGNTAYGDTYTTGDVIGVYLDLTASKLYFAKNGTIQDSGTGFDITPVGSTQNGFYFPAWGDWGSSYTTKMDLNFGNPVYALTSAVADPNGYGQFEYSPNDGGSASFDGSAKDFLAICSKNLGSDGG